MSVSEDIQTWLADQIRDTLESEVDGLNVNDLLIWNPTPPCIDIYPAEEYQEQQAFGDANDTFYLRVRARTNTPDNEAGQRLLLTMMDPTATTSVQSAINADQTLGGEVTQARVSEGPTGFGNFPDPSGQTLGFLGVTWVVQVTL